MSVRSLPIRVDPVAGESIQSWLRMLAYRNEVTWTQILQAVGLHRRRGDGRRTRWSQRLHAHEIAALTHATGVEPAVLQAMTLAVFDGIGISTGRRPRSPDYGAIHGLRSRSRYCPQCLADSGGRWQLRWHLGYTFACPAHQVILADTCPGCGHPPHPAQPTALSIPQPLRCEHRLRRGPRVAGCGADLRSAHPISAATSAVLGAQHVLDTIIDDKRAAFGVYQTAPLPADIALADTRALATRMLRRPDLIAAPAGFSPVDPSATADGVETSAPAYRTAMAVTAAIEILSGTDAAEAGQRMRPLIAAIREGDHSASVSSLISSRRPTSATLIEVQLNASAPWLDAADLFRYRVATHHPCLPRRPAAALARIIRALPSMLWPELAIRVCPDGADLRAAQAALATSVALVGTREPLGVVVTLLGDTTTARAVSHVWATLRATIWWEAIQHAVIRLADYLHQHRPSIDYQRRRALNYTALLPDARWAQICRTTDTPAGKPSAAAVARSALFARISGRAAEQAPWFCNHAGFRRQLAEFPVHTTPDLRSQLDTVATEFLVDHGVTEPLTWAPPISLLADLDLPGADPDTINIEAMHQLLTRPGASIASAARRLHVPADLIRHLANMNPPPPAASPTPRNQMRRIPELTPGSLNRLHHEQAQSLRVLARRHDMSRQTLTRIAATLNVGIRPPGRTQLPICDRAWLAHHYLTERHTTSEVAQMAGVSTSTISRWLRHHDIAPRSRGTASHRVAGAAHRASRAHPALPQPELRDPGARERLRRFQTAMGYPTLGAAACSLNTTEPVLSQQFRRLETEFGCALYHSAKRRRPMRPTLFGPHSDRPTPGRSSRSRADGMNMNQPTNVAAAVPRRSAGVGGRQLKSASAAKQVDHQLARCDAIRLPCPEPPRDDDPHRRRTDRSGRRVDRRR